MDLFLLLWGLIDFLKLLIPMAFIALILFKLLFPLREKIREKYSLSWIKSTLAFNFIVCFVPIVLIYIYFDFLGGALTKVIDPEITYDFFESITIFLISAVRIVIASVILALVLLFFEFVSSLVISMQEKKDYPLIAKEFIGILVSSAIFLLLFLFVFDWAALGLFFYIFYGGIRPLPLIISNLVLVI